MAIDEGMRKKVSPGAILLAASIMLVAVCSPPFVVRAYQEISLVKQVRQARTLDEQLAAFSAIQGRRSRFWNFDEYRVRLYDKDGKIFPYAGKYDMKIITTVEIEFHSGREIKVDLVDPGETGTLLYDY